jgi:O-methyltransferase involved in polyketide biosynthesis
MCEGLLLYLDVAVVARVLGGLRTRADRRAVLALSIAVRDRTDPVAPARRAAWEERLRGLGEPARTRLRRAEWDALLGATGWVPARAVDPHEIDPQAAPGGALLMTAEPAAKESARTKEMTWT